MYESNNNGNGLLILVLLGIFVPPIGAFLLACAIIVGLFALVEWMFFREKPVSIQEPEPLPDNVVPFRKAKSDSQ